MKPTVALIGSFDTKGAEYSYVRERILREGCGVVTINTGIFEAAEPFPVDVEAGLLAEAGGTELGDLRNAGDRGEAMKAMSRGAPVVIKRLYDEGKFDGIIGLGGSGGSAVITAAMRSLPVGVPKVCVSTVASGDVSGYVGIKDVVMFPSITDVAGINRISKAILANAASAVSGMVKRADIPSGDNLPIIAATMFGNTTQCVDTAREELAGKGYEVLVFHATGTGGRTMENLVAEGLVDAVLDITTTEWADEVCGGVFSAGADRLSAPGRAGIPHLIVPGCIDMANFGGPDTVPGKYQNAGRIFYEWNPSVTLMRTNVGENRRMGEVFAEKANAATGPVAVLIPLRGVSILGADGEQFFNREADQAFTDALRANIDPKIRIEEMDCNINDPAFSAKAVDMMLTLMKEGARRS